MSNILNKNCTEKKIKGANIHTQNFISTQAANYMWPPGKTPTPSGHIALRLVLLSNFALWT